MRLTPFHLSVAVLLSVSLHGGVSYIYSFYGELEPEIREEKSVIKIGKIIVVDPKPIKNQPNNAQNTLNETEVVKSATKIPLDPQRLKPPKEKIVSQVREKIIAPIAPVIPVVHDNSDLKHEVQDKLEADAVKSTYEDLLASYLEKFKSYPERALKRRQQGLAMLELRISREGSLVSYHISHSSKFQLLDDEVEALARRAVPYPEIPQELKGEYFSFTVPIDFRIR